jgi:hypothetical protein
MQAFPEEHLGIMNRVGYMKKLATSLVADYNTGVAINQVDAFTLARLVQVFFEDDLPKLTAKEPQP